MRTAVLLLLLATAAVLGAADLTPSGIVSPMALTSLNYVAAPYSVDKLFDGLTASNKTFVSGTQAVWVKLFIGPTIKWSVASYSFQVNSSGTGSWGAPKDWTFQGSNDGVTWDVLDTRAGVTWTALGAGQVQTFNCAATGTAYRFFLVNITANSSGVTMTQISEMRIYGTSSSPANFPPHDLTSNTSHAPFVASASSSSFNYDPWRASNGVVAAAGFNACWESMDPTGWLQLDTGQYATVTEYGFWANDASNVLPNAAPKNWTLQGSIDGSTWDTLDTRTGQTGWDVFPRYFACSAPACSAPHRYFRLNITLNNGDPNYVLADELYYYGTLFQSIPRSYAYIM